MRLIGGQANLRAVIFKRIKFGKKSFWTFSFDFFVQFGEFVQLDVACPMKPKQTTQTYTLPSTASEARSINLEKQGHRSGRSPRPDGPLAQSRPPTAPQKQSRPSQTQFFIPPCLPNHTSTDQVTTSLRISIAVTPSLLAAWGFVAATAHPGDPKSDSLLASQPVPAKRVCRCPRRSGEDARRRSPRWLPTGVS